MFMLFLKRNFRNHEKRQTQVSRALEFMMAHERPCIGTDPLEQTPLEKFLPREKGRLKNLYPEKGPRLVCSDYSWEEKVSHEKLNQILYLK